MNCISFMLVLSGIITYCHCQHQFEIYKDLLPTADKWERIQNILKPICENKHNKEALFDAFYELGQITGNIADPTLERYDAASRARAIHIIKYPFQDHQLVPFTDTYFFDKVIPFTACLALQVPNYFPRGIQVLYQNGRTHMSLTKAHTAILLSAGYWGVILENGPLALYHSGSNTRENVIPEDGENYNDGMNTNPEAALRHSKFINFSKYNFLNSFVDEFDKYISFVAYLCTMTKLISSYFPFDSKQMEIVTDNSLLSQGIFGGDQVSPPYERIDYILNHSQTLQSNINWGSSDIELKPIVLNKRRIEDAPNSIKVGFLNPSIGKTFHNFGNLQEDIYLATHPETLVAMLFVPRLVENEALIIAGAELYARHKGYGRAFSFQGCAMNCWFSECTQDNETNLLKQITDGKRVPLDETGRRQIFFSGIDASAPYNGKSNAVIERYLLKMLNKAYQGFKGLPYLPKDDLSISSGNWGSGSDTDNIGLNIIIQWLSASQAGRTLQYCPFQAIQFYNIERTSNILIQKYRTVGELYKSLLKLRRQDNWNLIRGNIIDELVKVIH